MKYHQWYKYVAYILVLAVVVGIGFHQSQSVKAAVGLTVEVIAGPNLIVDSNVLSSSTEQPIVATVIGKFCNSADETLTNVVGRIGDGVTAGTYPVITDPIFTDGVISTQFAGNYSFTHLGSAADATRYIGTLAPGECSSQYWSFTYPKTGIRYGTTTTIPTWGDDVKPGDDMQLSFIVWGSSSEGATGSVTHTMTMRNEISSMANKIEPNGNPPGQWFNTDTSIVYPGDMVTTSGILYRLGNVSQGFDNDGNGIPDYNAWLQPFGNSSFHPDCIRLVQTTGVLTVTVSGGDIIIPFTDTLYFTDLPQDNTNVIGLVYYKFLALDGPCSIPIAPYQEAASGSDNEKFNGDYGAGPDPVGAYAPEVTLQKSGPQSIVKPATGATTFTYSIPFANTSTTSTAGLTLETGGVDMPLVVRDTVPAGLEYVCGSAGTSLQSPNTATIYYSSDSGATWGTTEPAGCPGTNPTSSGNIVILWKLNNPLPKAPDPGSSGNIASFQAALPSTYSGPSFIENCANASFGMSGSTFAQACFTTMVGGTNSIGDFIWQDVDGDTLQDGTVNEPGINGVTVRLYWDENANGSVDSGEPQINAYNVTVIAGQLDLDNNGTANDNGEFDAYQVIGGLVDVNGDGSITSADQGMALIGGYDVIDGYLDINGNATPGEALDAGFVSGTQTASQGATVTNGQLDGTSFAGYTLSGGLVDLNGDGVINAMDSGTGLIGGFDTTHDTVVLFDVANGYVQSGGINVDGVTLSGTYGFAYLPDGSYIVQVTVADSSVPTGYTVTTLKQYAVTLTGGTTNNRGSDFGFGPVLMLNKYLASANPAYQGDQVTFKIDLVNKLPGDGTIGGFCQYTVWATSAGTHNGGTNWQSVPNAYSDAAGPDALYAYLNPASNVDTISADGIDLTLPAGTVFRKVEAIYSLYLDDSFVDDHLYADFWRNGTAYRMASEIPFGTINAYGPGQAMQGILAWDITTGYGTWSAADFSGNALEVGFDGQKNGGTNGDTILHLDAMGFRVTTNEYCGGSDTTIATLPLTDTYDPNRLEFVSASPVQSTVTSGTITWDNLGPLYAGGTKSVSVIFKTLDPGANLTTTTNTATATYAYFGNGLRVNDAQDTADVTIQATGKISGVVFSDVNANGWQGTTGYDSLGTNDYPIPGATVILWGCQLNGAMLNTDINTSKTCTAGGQSGTWVNMGTATTDSNGYYEFTGLRMGFYYVSVSGTGGTDRADAGSSETVQNGTGHDCNPCDDQWGQDSQNLGEANYNPIGTLSGTALINPAEDIGNINFGYQGVTARLFGTVYQDTNRDGSHQDTTLEPWIQGVKVFICATDRPTCTTSDNDGSGLTDANGNYSINVPTIGKQYYVVIDNTTLPANQAQTADPDQPDVRCTVCDGQTTTPIANTGQVLGAYDFGYSGSGQIGQILYTDWDGSGTRGTAAAEPGINDGFVSLYLDNGNGTYGSEDSFIESQLTSGDGDYLFTNLVAGTYWVVVTPSSLPGGYTQTGDPSTYPSPCAGATCDNRSSAVVLAAGDTNLDQNFGYQPGGFSMIGDYVWLDTDGDTIHDEVELGRANVTVDLYHDSNGDGVIDPNDGLIASTVTLGYNVIDGYLDINGDGAAPVDSGDDLPGGLYGVVVIDGGLDINNDGYIGAGLTYPADNGSFGRFRVINGRLDLNNDGAVDGADDGTLVGFYLFKDLPASSTGEGYIVQVDPSEFTAGGDLVGYGLTNMVDPYSLADVSYHLSLAASQQFFDVDFGFATTEIGDFIWADYNGNGIAESNEPGINGVVVQLYNDADNSGTINAGDTLIGTATTADKLVGLTNVPGYYLFTGMAPGNYIVQVADSNFTSGGALEGYLLSADPDVYNLSTPESVSCLDAGAQDCDNLKPYDRYASSSSLDSTPALRAGSNELTADFGYQPQGGLGDSVWIDADNDGLRDPAELGIPNVDVNLCSDATCTTILKTVSTDSNGLYDFGGLADNTTYYVQVDTTDPDFPSGLTQTYGTAIETRTIDISVNNGVDLTVDFGYRYSGNNNLTGTVWFDGNEDEIIDGTETNRYGNVPVYLWNCGDNDCFNGNEILVGSMTTGADGNYAFNNLADGTYRVLVNSNAYSLLGTSTTTPYPADNSGVEYPTTSLSGGISVARNFGYTSQMDLGDLPAAYRDTLLADNGARHTVGTLFLGLGRTVDPDGRESDTANGDADDGVMATGNWSDGTGSVNVTVTGGQGCLMGWLDYGNGSGSYVPDYDFNDPGEVIINNQPVNSGTTAFTFPLPVGAANNATWFMRFRLVPDQDADGVCSDQPAVLLTGLQTNGEVEDYRLVFGPTSVTLVDLTAHASTQSRILVWVGILSAIGMAAAAGWLLRRRHLLS